MPPEIIECDQGSDEWIRARMGVPTASMFKTVMAKGRDGGASVTRKEYMRKLAGELVWGIPMENWTGPHHERGKLMEEEARNYFAAFKADAELTQVGFIRNGQKGCSPDSLIGTDAMLEIKTAFPHLIIEMIERGTFPPEHKAQCQGGLWVAEREWVEIIIYWPGATPFTAKAYRDEPYIGTMAMAVDRFNEELAELVERVKRYGTPPDIKRDLEDSLISHDAMMKTAMGGPGKWAS